MYYRAKNKVNWRDSIYFFRLNDNVYRSRRQYFLFTSVKGRFRTEKIHFIRLTFLIRFEF